MKHITISDYGDNKSISVTDEIAEQIKNIIAGGLVCSICKNGYTKNNPQVLRNTCMTCVLKQSKDKRFLDSEEKLTGYPEAMRTSYKFINEEGRIYTANETSDALYYSMPETLRHWHFKVLPTMYKVTTENVGSNPDRYISDWYFAGNFTDQFIMAHAMVEYWDKEYKSKYIRLEYVLEKDGDIYELNKRKKATRELIKQAHQRAKVKRGSDWTSPHDDDMALLELITERGTVKEFI